MKKGFFIEDLLESLTGTAHQGPVSPFHAAEVSGEAAASFPSLFAESGAPPHLCLDLPLLAPVADRIQRELSRAPFKRHHHASYEIDILPRQAMAIGELPRFVDWLASEDGAAFHRAWVGWPPGRAALTQVQVQTARARFGDAFEEHVDSDEEGIAVVYAFSKGMRPADGGALYFPRPDGKGNALWVEPAFNRVLVFRPRGAPHGVTRIVSKRVTRYTITAFYLYGSR